MSYFVFNQLRKKLFASIWSGIYNFDKFWKCLNLQIDFLSFFFPESEIFLNVTRAFFFSLFSLLPFPLSIRLNELFYLYTNNNIYTTSFPFFSL